MAWIDFKKAYDSLSHHWIHTCLQLFRISDNICQTLLNVFPQFKTNILLGKNKIGTVQIKRGIFQGDALSPLLFILSLAPLSRLLNNENQGFRYKLHTKRQSISHLLFVDDIKLYASTQKDLKNLIHITEKFGKEVGLTFGIEKCATNTQKKEKKHVQDIRIESSTIKHLEEPYKYLGTFQLSEPALVKTKHI